MIGIRKDHSSSDVGEEWRRQGNQRRPRQMSRRKVRRTCIQGNQAGRRGARCRKMMGNEWQEGGRMDPGVVLLPWEPFVIREPLRGG